MVTLKKEKSSLMHQIIFLLEILRINILKALRWIVVKRSVILFFFLSGWFSQIHLSTESAFHKIATDIFMFLRNLGTLS